MRISIILMYCVGVDYICHPNGGGDYIYHPHVGGQSWPKDVRITQKSILPQCL